ncbi:hypothetical protein BSLG_008016 [Batrachochytrium salamandrivorans]|nr:hypothetical protein BSLG_008016 [Batrachochytrium salamandrivorans]
MSGSHPPVLTDISDSDRLDIELIVICAAAIYCSPLRSLPTSTVTKRSLSLYAQCLKENEILTGVQLPLHERQVYLDSLIPTTGLAAFFADTPHPVHVDNVGVFMLELSSCPSPTDSNPLLVPPKSDATRVPLVDDDPQLQLRHISSDCNAMINTPLPFIPKLLPLLIDMAKAFDLPSSASPTPITKDIVPLEKDIVAPTTEKVISSVVSTPIPTLSESTPPKAATVSTTVSTTVPSQSPVPASKVSATVPSQSPVTADDDFVSPTTETHTPSRDGSITPSRMNADTTTKQPSAYQLDKVRASIIACALCLYFIKDKVCLNSDLGNPLRDLHGVLSTWVKETSGVEIGSLPKSKVLSFFGILSSPLVSIHGHVWSLARSLPFENGTRTISMNSIKSPTEQQSKDAIVIDAAWIDFAESCFDEGDFTEGDTEETSSSEIMSQFSVPLPPKVQVDNLETAVDLQNFYVEFTRLAGQPNRRDFVEKVQHILDKAYGRTTRVYLFGSSVNNLGLNTSDVDMTIEIAPHLIEHHRARNMYNLARALHAGGMADVHAITHARVPICKFYDPKFHVHADINIGHNLGVFNSALLKAYTLLDPRVKPLILLIKLWAKARNLNNPANGGTLSSYAYSIMAIAYMQRLGILPSLQAAVPPGHKQIAQVPVPEIAAGHRRSKPGPKRPILMREVDVTFEHDVNSPLLTRYAHSAMLIGWDNVDEVFRSVQGVVPLFYGFMRYFGYEHIYDACHRVSIKEGSGFKTVDASDDTSHGRSGHSSRQPVLYVEDPFEVERNCSRGTTSHSLLELVKEFRRAADLVASGSSDIVNELLGRSGRSSVSSCTSSSTDWRRGSGISPHLPDSHTVPTYRHRSSSASSRGTWSDGHTQTDDRRSSHNSLGRRSSGLGSNSTNWRARSQPDIKNPDQGDQKSNRNLNAEPTIPEHGQ